MANGWPVRKETTEKAMAFDSLNEMPGIFILITNTKFELLYANAFFYTFFECSSEDLIGRALYGFLSDDLQPDMNEAHIEKIIKEGHVWDYDASTVTADGEPVCIKWNQEILFFDKKNPVIFSVGIPKEIEKPKQSSQLNLKETAENATRNESVKPRKSRNDRNLSQLSNSKMNIDEEEIEQGLNEGLFKLYYQPLIQARGKKIIGAEALLRLEHPTKGTVLPEAILPIAEKTGQIIPLGKFVIKAACKKIRDWANAGLDLNLSVNFSCRQFLNDDLAETLLREVTLHDVAAGRLTLEVTEDTVAFDLDKAKEVIRTLRGLGCKICLDDFGTGFSSLKTLENLEIDTLKIDRLFLPNAENNRKSYALVESMIMLAHGLGFSVTAAGIETDTQAEKLMDMSCDYFQGFLFSRPVPEDDFDRLLLDTPGFYLRNV